jgi:hypothetical protein
MTSLKQIGANRRNAMKSENPSSSNLQVVGPCLTQNNKSERGLNNFMSSTELAENVGAASMSNRLPSSRAWCAVGFLQMPITCDLRSHERLAAS